MKNFAKIMITAAISVSLVGCTDMGGPLQKQDVGVLAGGVAGGLLGSQIGGGSGRVVATVGGALLGAMIGGSIGKSMDDVDRMKMSQVLETSPTNEAVVWHNPDSGYNYRVKPTRTFRAESGQPCREYITTATIGGKRQQLTGTACRQADGSWRSVN